MYVYTLILWRTTQSYKLAGGSFYTASLILFNYYEIAQVRHAIRTTCR